MQYYIYHWQGGHLPAETHQIEFMVQGEMKFIDVIDIDNIHEFAVQYEQIGLIPPSYDFRIWSVYVGNRKGWGQR